MQSLMADMKIDLTRKATKDSICVGGKPGGETQAGDSGAIESFFITLTDNVGLIALGSTVS